MGHHHNRYTAKNSSVIVPANAVPYVVVCGATKMYSYFLLEPMEEDILQVVKYCTDLIEDKDLEKLDLIIKYMKR